MRLPSIIRRVPPSWFAVLYCLSLSACSDSPIEPDMTPEQPDPWIEVLGQTVRARAVHAFAADDVFVLGVNGHISRFDGQQWTLVDALGGWGMRGIWGSSPDNVIMVGFKGRVARFDGTSWTDENSRSEAFLWDVWGSGPSNIYAVGDDGAILRYDGSGWKSEDSGVSANLRGVHGTDDGHVYAVGAGGTVLLRTPGAGWETVHEDASAMLQDVWAASSDWAIAVGDDGPSGRLILQRANGIWTTSSSAPGFSLQSVDGNSDDDVLAVGIGGAWRWNGQGWTEEFSGGALVDVHFTDDGATVYQIERNTTSIEVGGTRTPWNNGIGDTGVAAIVGFGDDDVMLVSASAAHLRFDGQSFSVLQNPRIRTRHAWGNADGSRVFLVGQGNQVHRLENGVQSEFHTVQSTSGLNTVWGVDSELFVGGDDGWVAHFDGATWTDTQLPTTFHGPFIGAIDGSAPDDVYALSRDTIFRFDGDEWTIFHELGDDYFLDNLLVVGPNEIYAEGSFEFGQAGLFLDVNYFNGTSWTRPVRNSSYSIADLARAPDGSVVGVGIRFFSDPSGFIMRGRQTQWAFEGLELGLGFGIEDVWVSDSGRTWLCTNENVWRSSAP